MIDVTIMLPAINRSDITSTVKMIEKEDMKSSNTDYQNRKGISKNIRIKMDIVILRLSILNCQVNQILIFSLKHVTMEM